jgi:hypothetical protein
MVGAKGGPDTLFRAKRAHMPEGIRIVPKRETGKGQTITFVLAIGSHRQTCRLETTFQTERQALSYLHKYRTAIERVARARLARGELEDGVIHLTMQYLD